MIAIQSSICLEESVYLKVLAILLEHLISLMKWKMDPEVTQKKFGLDKHYYIPDKSMKKPDKPFGLDLEQEINLSNSLGDNFERDLADEFGIRRVPGSGNQAHSKLDLYGNGFRWSLKATDGLSASIKLEDVREAIQASYGLNGTGETPLWAFRIQDEDLVMMRKADFVALQRGEIRAINEEKGKEKVMERRRKASTPSLLRDE